MSIEKLIILNSILQNIEKIFKIKQGRLCYKRITSNYNINFKTSPLKILFSTHIQNILISITALVTTRLIRAVVHYYHKKKSGTGQSQHARMYISPGTPAPQPKQESGNLNKHFSQCGYHVCLHTCRIP